MAVGSARGWLGAGVATASVGLILGMMGPGAQAATSVPGPELEYEWEAGSAATVHDGDTLDVRISKSNSGYRGTQRVRTIGVQAPEVQHTGQQAQCGAAQAKSALKALAPSGTPIQLRALKGTSYDDYSGGRLVRSIYAQDGEGNWFDTARQLVSAGTMLWFPLSDTSSRKPEWAHNLEYRVLADDAASAHRGLWKPNYCGTSPAAGADLRMWVAYDTGGSYEKAWIANDGTSNVAIGGWTLRDSALNKYTFPSGSYIPKGGVVEVRLASGRTVGPTGPFYVNSSTWFNNLPAKNSSFVGDAAYLMDDAGPYETGNLRSWFAYPCNPDTCNDPANNPLKGVVSIDAVRATDPQRTRPSIPQAVVAQAALDGSGAVSVTWAAPSDLGGPASDLTYTVAAAPSAGADVVHSDKSSGTTSRSFSGANALVAGTSYTFSVTARNAQGSSTSVPTGAVVPTTKPGAPTGLVLAPRAGAVAVSWTRPASDGFRQITGYDVQVTPAGGAPYVVTTTRPATSTLVTLANTAVSHTFAVRARAGATNVVTGPFSSPGVATPLPVPTVPPTEPVEPAPTAPGQPAAPGVFAHSSSEVVVSWSPPADDGGSPITSYVVTNSSGEGTHTCTAVGGVTSCVVPGLLSGSSYTFTVSATNAAGNGPASEASDEVTPKAYPTRPAGPTSPTPNAAVEEPWQHNEQVVLRNTSASAVHLDGHALYDKDAREGKYDSPDFIFPAGTTIPAGGSLRVVTGSDLTPKTTGADSPLFTKGVNFLDDAGDRVELSSLTKAPVDCLTTSQVECSVRSDPTTPTQPVGVTARTTPGSVTIQWGAPISRGGIPITGYTATAFDARNGGRALGTCSTNGGGRQCSIAGRIGVQYYAEVVASNAQGASAPSAPRVLAAPRTVPSAPGSVTVTGTPGGVTVAWKPAAQNGAVITRYTAAAYKAGTGGRPVASCSTSNGSMTSCSIVGLDGRSKYFIDVVATNRAGNGAPSSPRVSGTPGPGAALSTYSKRRVTVRWDPPATGSHSITGYTARLYTRATGGTKVGECSAPAGSTSCTTKKMKKRSKYYIDLTMQSAAGASTIKPRIVTGPPRKASAPPITSAAPSGKTVAIAWAPPAFAGYSYLKGYGARLYSKSKHGSVKASCSAGPAAGTCTTKPVKQGTYYATARVKNSKGWSKWSKRVKVLVR